jgi:hypothetical protein
VGWCGSYKREGISKEGGFKKGEFKKEGGSRRGEMDGWMDEATVSPGWRMEDGRWGVLFRGLQWEEIIGTGGKFLREFGVEREGGARVGQRKRARRYSRRS